MSGLLNWLFERSDNVLCRKRQFTVLVNPAFQVFTQCEASYSQVITVDQLVLQQVVQNFWQREVEYSTYEIAARMCTRLGRRFDTH